MRSECQGYNTVTKQRLEQNNLVSEEFVESSHGNHKTRNEAKEKIKKIQGMKKKLSDNYSKVKNSKNFGKNKMSFQVADKNILGNSIDIEGSQRSKFKNNKNSKLIDYGKRMVKKEEDEDEGEIRIKYSTQSNYLRPKSAMKPVANTTIKSIMLYFFKHKSVERNQDTLMSLIECDDENEEILTGKFSDFQRRFKIKQSNNNNRNLMSDCREFHNTSMDYTIDHELRPSSVLDKSNPNLPQKVSQPYNPNFS